MSYYEQWILLQRAGSTHSTLVNHDAQIIEWNVKAYEISRRQFSLEKQFILDDFLQMQK